MVTIAEVSSFRTEPYGYASVSSAITNAERLTLCFFFPSYLIFIVEADGSLTLIRLLNKQENSMVKRNKVRLTGGAY